MDWLSCTVLILWIKFWSTYLETQVIQLTELVKVQRDKLLIKKDSKEMPVLWNGVWNSAAFLRNSERRRTVSVVSLSRFIPSSLGLADGSTLWLLLWNTKQRKCSAHCEGGKMTRGTLRHGCIDRWRERQRRERGPDKYVLSLQLSEEMLNKTSEACWSQKNTVFTSKTGFRRRRQSGQVETDQGLKWLLVLGLLCLLTYSSSVDKCNAISKKAKEVCQDR